MIIIYGIILLFYIVLLFISFKKKNKFDSGSNPFDKAASYLYGKLHRKNLFHSKQIECDLVLTNPGISVKGKDGHGNGQKSYQDHYYIRKISFVLLLIFAGDILAIALWISAQSNNLLVDGKYINRNDYGNGSVEAQLHATIHDNGEESKQEFAIVIEERRYEKEVIQQLAKDVLEILPEMILDSNSSTEEIRHDLNLVQEIEGYPFKITWESDNYALVYSDGTVENENIDQNGEVVSLIAMLSYNGYKEEYIFPVRVLPPIYSREEWLQKEIVKKLNHLEEISEQEEKLILPEIVEEAEIEWREKKEDSSSVLFLLICIGSFGTYFIQDKELHKQAKIRDRQMLLDYPGIVSRLVLYMGAGMTIRNAFRKIAYDYRKQKEESKSIKRYVYEEMLITCYELDGGVSELSAYENFGKRCRLPQYIKFSNLLSQNLRKGSNNLLIVLRQEAVSAFDERKNLAKKLGEEAGTKLLFPMMLMLGIVMLLIIVPAYFSFSV